MNISLLLFLILTFMYVVISDLFSFTNLLSFLGNQTEWYCCRTVIFLSTDCRILGLLSNSLKGGVRIWKKFCFILFGMKTILSIKHYFFYSQKKKIIFQDYYYYYYYYFGFGQIIYSTLIVTIQSAAEPPAFPLVQGKKGLPF